MTPVTFEMAERLFPVMTIHAARMSVFLAPVSDTWEVSYGALCYAESDRTERMKFADTAWFYEEWIPFSTCLQIGFRKMAIGW